MFDIGFLEIIVILVITLLVIGPERMPEVARKIGQFVGKTKRFINSVKQNSEITDAVKEIQDSINLEEEKKSFDKVTSGLQDDLSQIQQQFEIDEEVSRPFAQTEAAGSQFNKAPSQPMPSQPKQVAEQTTEQPTETAQSASTEKATQVSETTDSQTDKPYS